MHQDKGCGWPTIVISEVLELVILGMHIAVYGSSMSRVKQRHTT